MADTVKATNVVWHEGYVAYDDFKKRNAHEAAVVWFTGLSGSGKSTVAREVEWRLHEMGKQVYVLDGDNIRHGLNKDLGFTPEDRVENIRRIGEVAKLFRESGTIVLTAFISPYIADRDIARQLLPEGAFHEVFVDCPLDECIKRDPKGLYQKAIDGVIPNFTGISAPYEAPENPSLTLQTGDHSLEECVDQVVAMLKEQGII